MKTLDDMSGAERCRMVVREFSGRKKYDQISQMENGNKRELEFKLEARKALKALYEMLNPATCNG